MDDNLAPIVLFVYDRPWHAKQTVEALQKNELASDSELFIFSDAAKNDNALEKVVQVRNYIKTINGFKKVTIIKQDKNFGLANSIIYGVTKIVNQYGKIIVLEDDLITSSYFLRFMNEALDYYYDDNRIFSISGYVYPFPKLKSCNDDVFVWYRSSSWGWSTWKDKWDSIDFDMDRYRTLVKEKHIKKKLSKGGEDLYGMLLLQCEGKIDSWAIRVAVSMVLNQKLGLFPMRSLVQNIGFDSYGTHTHNQKKWFVNLSDQRDFAFIKNIKLNDKIIKQVELNFKTSLIKKIIMNIIKNKGLQWILYQFRNQA